jgi:hypothetical protein
MQKWPVESPASDLPQGLLVTISIAATPLLLTHVLGKGSVAQQRLIKAPSPQKGLSLTSLRAMAIPLVNHRYLVPE